MKFADAELIGCPIIITLGSRGLKERKVELKLRKNLDEKIDVSFDDLITKVKELIEG